MMLRVKKNDTVKIMAGKDKGKTGDVITLLPTENKVLVKGIALVTKHMKARRQGESPRIVKQESYINLSNVMPVCRSCSQPCRIHIKFLENGKKARVCSNCQELL